MTTWVSISAVLQFLLWMQILSWKGASGYMIKEKSGSIHSDQIEQLIGIDRYGNLIEMHGAAENFASLIDDLDQPVPIMTMADRLPTDTKDIDCPLDLCTHVRAVVLAPNRPRLFVVCLQNHRFCGLCPEGTVVQSDDHAFRCSSELEKSINDTAQCDAISICQFKTSETLLLSKINSSRIDYFAVCSEKRTFCGFCPSETAHFNESTLTCDLAFPESQLICENGTSTRIISDPLAACSPLAYVCLPGRRRAVTVRCPNPKMRRSQSRSICDEPEYVPECGGSVRESGNQTSSEIDLPINGTQLARGGEPTANCIGNCMYDWRKPKNFCIRFCTN